MSRIVEELKRIDKGWFQNPNLEQLIAQAERRLDAGQCVTSWHKGYGRAGCLNCQEDESSPVGMTKDALTVQRYDEAMRNALSYLKSVDLRTLPHGPNTDSIGKARVVLETALADPGTLDCGGPSR